MSGGEVIEAETVESSALATAPGAAPTQVDYLISRAIDRSVPVESLEKLLAMRRELMAEAAKREFLDAMRAFQAAMPVVEKTRKPASGPQYLYASHEDIVRVAGPILDVCGFTYRFDAEFVPPPPAAPTHMLVTCIVSHRAGHEERSTFPVPIESGNRMSPQHMMASAGSYARRYAFNNVFGIVTGDGDDDAAAAAPPPRPAKVEPPRQQERKAPAPAAAPPEDPSLLLAALSMAKTDERLDKMRAELVVQHGLDYWRATLAASWMMRAVEIATTPARVKALQDVARETWGDVRTMQAQAPEAYAALNELRKKVTK